MSTHTLNHPATADLDAWRADLLDAAAANDIAAHLAACTECAQAANVSERLHRLAKTASPELERQLRVRRRTALATPARRAAMSAPRWALAASVSAMALGLALYLGTGEKPSGQGLEGDVYADVDFYLWLAERDEQANDARNPS